MMSSDEQLAHLNAMVHRLQQQLASLEDQRTIQAVHTVGPSVPKPETFNGKGNVHSWLWSLEQYFATTNINQEHAKTQYAVNLFRGNIATWMRTFLGAGPLPEWRVVREELLKMFAPISEQQQARDRLASLKQRNSVGAYSSQFLQLLLLLDTLPEAEKIDRFARGLKLPVAREVHLRNPSTLDEAIRIAERYDAITWQMRSKQPPRTNSLSPSLSTPVAMDLSSVRFKKLTAEERKRIMDNNGCLYCRKLNVDHRAKNCPSKSERTSVSPSN